MKHNFCAGPAVLPQSIRAFYIYARAVKVMYEIGASVELKRLGYKWQPLV